MATVQSTYVAAFREGTVGMIVNSEVTNVISRTANNTIGFGQPVTRAGEHNCILSVAGAVAGIAVRDTTLGAGDESYVAGDSVAIMTQGVMWVQAGAGVTAGGLVYWAAGTGKYSSVGTDLAVTVQGRQAVFDDSGSTNDLVRIAIR